MKKGIIRHCRVCKKTFYIFPYRIEDNSRGKFCSRKCQIVGRSVVNLGQNPKSLANLKKMTSQRAKELGFGKWMKGKKLPEEIKAKIGLALKGGNSKSFKKGSKIGIKTQFKKGHTPKNKGKGIYCKLSEIIRSCLKYRKWRASIYKRDKWTCQNCGYVGRNINAEHKKPFVVILKENNLKTLKEAESCNELWDINNGVTLCVPCHKKTPTYFKRLCFFRNLNFNYDIK